MNGDQHCSPNCHSGVSVEGSSTVYINNRQAMRVGDPISCGDFAMTGSDDVFIGPNDRYKDTLIHTVTNHHFTIVRQSSILVHMLMQLSNNISC